MDAKPETSGVPLVVQTVVIHRSVEDVWRAITDPNEIARWMAGTRVLSTWEVGSDISFTGRLPNFNKAYHDRGTVLAIEQNRLLSYSHWSEMSHLPDSPENRTIITYVLERLVEGTHLTVRHEHFYSGDAYKHAHFFWGVALSSLKRSLEQTTE